MSLRHIVIHDNSQLSSQTQILLSAYTHARTPSMTEPPSPPPKIETFRIVLCSPANLTLASTSSWHRSRITHLRTYTLHTRTHLHYDRSLSSSSLFPALKSQTLSHVYIPIHPVLGVSRAIRRSLVSPGGLLLLLSPSFRLFVQMMMLLTSKSSFKVSV